MKGRRLGTSTFAAAMACFSLAAAAAAASAPVAQTGPVTSYGPTSVTVSGTVNPSGQATTWYFEYGKGTSYGSKTTAMNAGSGAANTTVSATIGDLAPKTTYHYRFVATNATGTAQGADGLFTTSAAPVPDVVTGSASNLAATSATLSGTVNPNSRATTWYFEYGTSTGYGTRTPAQNAGSGTSPTQVSAPISGLTTGRTYHFRLVGTSDAGTGRGADQSFSLGAAPAVSTSAASSVSLTTARLNGTVNPNGQATSWHFEYGTSTGYGSTTPAKNAGSGTHSSNVSAALSGLTAGATYHFRLVATNAVGTSAGDDQTFATVSGPVAQTGSAQSVGTTTATLTGTVDPRSSSSTWYFEYGTSTRYGSRTSSTRVDANTGSRGVSSALSRLSPGTTYHFRLVVTSSAGTSRGADAAFTTAAAAPAATISLSQSAHQTTYGHYVTLSGTTSGGQSGVKVTVLAQKFGDSAFAPIATVLTGGGGRWTYPARPTIRTSYQASANGATSPAVTIGVRPAVSLSVIRHARFSTHVRADGSFAGRFVQLQRASHGRWVTVRRARLNRASSATFRASVLPHGRSTIRIALSVNQAGPGYLAGFSRTVVYRRG